MHKHVMDRPFTVTTQRKTVGHVTASVLAQVESMLSLMRMLRIAIGHHHLCQR